MTGRGMMPACASIVAIRTYFAPLLLVVMTHATQRLWKRSHIVLGRSTLVSVDAGIGIDSKSEWFAALITMSRDRRQLQRSTLVEAVA